MSYTIPMEIISSKGRNSGKRYAAFFDLDGTIIGANSGKAMILLAYKKGFISWIDIIKGLYLSFLYRFAVKDTVKIINSMVGWLKGVPETGLRNLSEELFKNHLIKSVYPEIVQEIMFHKKEGGMVVILSSAIMPVCREIANHLEINEIICSTLETKDGMLTGNPEGKLCFGTEKVIRLIEFCSENSMNPEQSWYYGDSIADLPVLSSVGYPVCVNPDKKLLKAAGKRGWKILTSSRI
jgi:putative phosphoserine phosphatase/1-acylglycerol-3-phosphate O-acyltransferase